MDYFEQDLGRRARGRRAGELRRSAATTCSRTSPPASGSSTSAAERGAFTAALAQAGAGAVGVEVAAEAAAAGARSPSRARVPSARGPPTPPPVRARRVRRRLGGRADRAPAGPGRGLLEDVRRVLGADGRLLLSTPDHPLRLRLRLALSRGAFEAHFDPRSDHLRFFTARTLALTARGRGLRHAADRAAPPTLLACALR